MTKKPHPENQQKAQILFSTFNNHSGTQKCDRLQCDKMASSVSLYVRRTTGNTGEDYSDSIIRM